MLRVRLDYASIRALSFKRCEFLLGISGRGLTVTGRLVIQDCVAAGNVALEGSTIGSANFERTVFRTAKPETIKALNLNTATIHRSVRATKMFAIGEASFIGAHIGGELTINDAHFVNAYGSALYLRELTVDRSIHAKSVKAYGRVNGVGANIGGGFNMVSARLKVVDRRTAPSAAPPDAGASGKTEAEDDLLQDDPGDTADTHDKNRALDLIGMKTGRWFNLDDVLINGRARLTAASIGGRLQATRLRIDPAVPHPDDRPVNPAEKSPEPDLRQGLQATGLTVGRDFDVRGTDTQRSRIATTFSLPGANVAGNLSLDKIDLGGHPTALVAARLKVGGTLYWRDVNIVTNREVSAFIDLQDANVFRFAATLDGWHDMPPKRNKAKYKETDPNTRLYTTAVRPQARLAGFSYETFGDKAPTYDDTVAWLDGQSESDMSSYVTAANAYRERGNDKASPGAHGRRTRSPEARQVVPVGVALGQGPAIDHRVRLSPQPSGRHHRRTDRRERMAIRVHRRFVLHPRR